MASLYTRATLLACVACTHVHAASLKEAVAAFNLAAVDITVAADLGQVVDMDLLPCNEGDGLCETGHGFEVLQGNPTQIQIDPSSIQGFGESHHVPTIRLLLSVFLPCKRSTHTGVAAFTPPRHQRSG